MTTTSGDPPGILEDQGRPLPLPAGTRRARRRRRPTGEAPPLPRALQASGVGWLRLTDTASTEFGFITREALRQALSQRSGGRLGFDAAASRQPDTEPSA